MPSNTTITNLTQLPPKEAAKKLLLARAASGAGDPAIWLKQFQKHLIALSMKQTPSPLPYIIDVWGLNQSQTAGLFGISRQALNKWLSKSPPAKRYETLANLAAATDLLLHHLKRERIPAVVRRQAKSLNNKSLLDLLTQDDGKAVLAACRGMFDFRAVQG